MFFVQAEGGLELKRFHVANVTATEFREDYEPLHEPLVIDVSASWRKKIVHNRTIVIIITLPSGGGCKLL